MTRDHLVNVIVRRVATIAGQAPFTVATLVVLWGVGLLTGSIVAGPDSELAQHVGAGVPALRHGRWWTPVTSLLWCDNLVAYLATTVVLLALVAPAERRFGLGRTAIAFLSTHVAGVLVAAGGVTVGARASDWCARDLVGTVAVGPSTGAVGVALAFSTVCTPLWRRRLRVVLLVTLAMLALYSGGLQDVLRLFAGLIGVALGPWLAREAPYLAGLCLPAGTSAQRLRPSLPSGPEVRLLLAVVTAASAMGPLIAAISGNARGPMISLQYVLLPASQQIGQLIPVLLLLVLAEGLRRGRRFALVATVAANLTLGAFGGAALVGALSIKAGLTGPEALKQLFAMTASALHPVVVAAILIVCRRSFTVAAPDGLYRRLGAVTAAALGLVSTAYVVVGLVVADQFVGDPGIADFLADLPMRFIPPGYVESAHPLVAVGPVANALYQWVGTVFWTVVFAGVLSTFWRSRVEQRNTDAVQARDLLRRYGGSELSFMTTWRGNKYWFSADGRVVVTYRVVGPVALTVGDPVGDPAGVPAAALDFTRFCVANGWTPCFYSVGDPLATSLGSDGWKLVQVAEETRLLLPGLAFTGRRWQDVRTAVNRAKRSGITAQWHTFNSSPAEVAQQIRAISAQWVADKGMPEMGFTLGGLEELSDDEVRCLLAVDDEGLVQAITSWMPVYRDGRIDGWTLDLMRRRRGADNGLMEFLIATAAMRFKEEGAEFMSLSGAPLARLDRGQPPTRLQRMLDRVGLALEPVYGFRSLLAFKSKFQPQYRPLFMAYPETVALPAIGGAVARAYLPDLTVPQGLRLAARTLRRGRGGARRPAVQQPAPAPAQQPPVPAAAAPAAAVPATAQQPAVPVPAPRSPALVEIAVMPPHTPL
jgi:phosphatidylglycerol lysyltransferase